MKFMLDSNIYDKIIATPEMVDRLNQFSKDGKVVLLCTHIQEDELSNIPDEQKRAAIAMIVKEKIPTTGAVFGVSKFGLATYGDGSSSSVSLDDVRSPSKGHTKDALIATTAAKCADVFVTEEKRLKNRLKALKPHFEVWKFDQFKKYIFEEL